MAKKKAKVVGGKVDKDILLVILGVVAVVAIASLVVLFTQTMQTEAEGQKASALVAPEQSFANRGLPSRQSAYTGRVGQDWDFANRELPEREDAY